MPKITPQSELHERMLIAVGDRTYRLVGELTKTHPETVRRYLQGQAPSTEFVTALCDVFGINPDWLLRGKGVMRAEDVLGESLQSASPSQLLTGIGTTIEALCVRLDRLESALLTMEREQAKSGSDQTLRIVPTELSTTSKQLIG